MSTAVQRRRGTTAQHSSFAGLEGELTVDTTKDTLVVHDGATAGGRPLLREDQTNLPSSVANGIYVPSANNVAISTNGTGRLFVDSSGNVGVGTNLPDVELHVHSTSQNPAVQITRGAVGSEYGYALYGADGATSAALRFFTIENGAGTGEKMRLDSSGRLGLGTSTIDAKLQIVDTGTAQIRVGYDTASNFAKIGRNSGGEYEISLHEGGSIFRIQTADTANTPVTALTVDRYQRVGIGTTTVNSGAAVHIARNTTGTTAVLRLSGNDGSGDGGAGIAFADNETVKWSLFTRRYSSNNRLYLSTAENDTSAAKVTITETGSVGIGTTSAADKLHIDGGNIRITGSDPQYIQAVGINLNLNTDNRNILFSRGGTEMARFDTSSRFLVGTSSSPSASQGQFSLAVVQGYVGGANGAGDFSLQRGQAATAMSSGDDIGYIKFNDSAGNTFANIAALVDATPGASDYPGRLVFSTTADGASSPTERVRVTSAGFTKHTGNGVAYYSATSNNHEFNSDHGSYVLILKSEHASQPAGIFIKYTATPNNTASPFIEFEDNAALRFKVVSNGGIYNYSGNNSNLSDEREKKNVESLDSTWGCLKNWELKKFHYNEDADTDDKRYGVIAQQVAPHCPEVISEWVKQEAAEAVLDDDGNVVTPAVEEVVRMGVKEQQMMWMAIKALQEAQLRIETLEAEVAALKGA